MAVYMEQVECLQTVRAICKPGGRVVLHSTSLGKSMLAAMRAEEVNRILMAKGMTRFTPKTIDTPARMATHLGEVRAVGYAVDDEEYSPGLRCVAAAAERARRADRRHFRLWSRDTASRRERLPQLGSLVRSIAANLPLSSGQDRRFASARALEVSTTRTGGPAVDAPRLIRILDV